MLVFQGRKFLAILPCILVSVLIVYCPSAPRRATFGSGTSVSYDKKYEPVDAVGAHTMSRIAFWKANIAKAKRSKQPAAKFSLEQLESRHMFSMTSVVDAVSPVIATSWGETTLSAPPVLSFGDPMPLDNQRLPIVYAGADFNVSANLAAQLNAELIINGSITMSLQWSLVSGPGNAVFSNSTAINSTVQFDAIGTYVLDLTVSAAGTTRSDQVTVNVTASNVINIDQAWLDAQGDGPYYLDQQGKTYVLQTDVTTDGTAFAIIAKDVVFDLNGHTITYDNAAPIVIPNGSFEAGTGGVASGWDFTTAPGASRRSGRSAPQRSV